MLSEAATGCVLLKDGALKNFANFPGNFIGVTAVFL